MPNRLDSLAHCVVQVFSFLVAGKLRLPRHIPLLLVFATAVASCEAPGEEDQEEGAKIGTVAQAFTDTDSDGMDDAWETSNFGNLSQTGTGDYDADGMTNGEEYTYNFNPKVNDAFDDADGDRYPNVFEVRRSSNPNSATSLPTANYTVDASGGGTHTTVSAAVTASTIANGAYQIIAIAPGVYSTSANLRGVTINNSKPKTLFIGTAGAAKTIFDGTLNNWGWYVSNSAVIASLTFRNTLGALYVDASGQELRLVDVVVRDNTTTPTEWATPGLHADNIARVKIVNSTFLNNTGNPAVKNIYVNNGTATLFNTVVWNPTAATMLGTGFGSFTYSYSLVKGQTLSGTGNLAGTTDPKLVSKNGHIAYDSPLRGVGGTTTQSHMDMDGETRPSTSPDMGADQFIDTDSDGLADAWELQQAGSLTALTGTSQDADGDTLSNETEYVNNTNPTAADSDGDGVNDADELNIYGTDPNRSDTDSDDMPDGWEIAHGLSATVANAFDDLDGDRYPNIFEYARSSDPNDRSSIPNANYVVDTAGTGTHTTVSAALSAANVANGNYQIIGIKAGTYTGSANLRGVNVAATKPKLLFIGLGGPANTIIDGGNANWGWWISGTAIVSGITFQNTRGALYVDAAGKEIRLVDLIVRDNVTIAGEAASPGLQVDNAAAVQIVGSTFLNNRGAPSVQQISLNMTNSSGAVTFMNTVVWSSTAGTMFAWNHNGTLTTNNTLVKGQTLSGTGNLAGSTDPRLRVDAHLLWNSPLRASGGTTWESRLDMDGELRPSTTPDIGVDQFVDSDADQLSDTWEIAYAGNLTTLTSRTQDADSDGLNDDGEYSAGSNPLVADTDGDGVSDGVEVNTYGSSPVKTDTDADDMPDGWEIAHGVSPTIANAFDDLDGDRYPNVFEYVRSSDPNDRTSIPTANYVVDAGGTGTHTTVSAALGAADVANGNYQIIGIKAGTYTGSANLRGVNIAATKPKILFIGLAGAAKTVIDGGNANYGWFLSNTVIVAGLTFQNTLGALYIDALGKEVRLIDLLVRDNVATPTETASAGVQVANIAALQIVGSTFMNNRGSSTIQQISITSSGAATAAIVNTVVWSATTGTMLAALSPVTLTTSYSLVKGQTLAGTGNLPATTDPKLRTDYHLKSNSPLRGAGGASLQSRTDFDNEPRPATSPDVGVDGYYDSDNDHLQDFYEIALFGNVTTIAGSDDSDNDELNEEGEYNWETDRLNPDTDRDGALDGVEVAYGTNPLVADFDDVATDNNHDGLIDSVGAQAGFQPDKLDDDGDGVSNVDEIAMGMNPFRVDSDGDGVADNADAFPLDPLAYALVSTPGDTTPPTITLTAPWYAVAQ